MSQASHVDRPLSLAGAFGVRLTHREAILLVRAAQAETPPQPLVPWCLTHLPAAARARLAAPEKARPQA